MTIFKDFKFAEKPTEFGNGLIIGVFLGGLASLLGMLTGHFLY